jgi:hypothetical protein
LELFSVNWIAEKRSNNCLEFPKILKIKANIGADVEERKQDKQNYDQCFERLCL